MRSNLILARDLSHTCTVRTPFRRTTCLFKARNNRGTFFIVIIYCYYFLFSLFFITISPQQLGHLLQCSDSEQDIVFMMMEPPGLGIKKENLKKLAWTLERKFKTLVQVQKEKPALWKVDIASCSVGQGSVSAEK